MTTPTKRIQTILRFGIVFGTISQPVTKDSRNQGANAATHKWTVYVRHPDGRCLSPFLESVTFILHNSFADYRRVVTQPPYHVSEVGWGEFDIGIELNFKPEAEERPIALSHFLRLFLDPPVKSEKLAKKPVISEQMDELIFVNPTEKLNQIFANEKVNPPPQPPLPNQLTPLLVTFSKLNQDLYDAQVQQKLEVARQYAHVHTQNVLYLTQQLKLHAQLAQLVDSARRDGQLANVATLPQAPPVQAIMGPVNNPALVTQPGAQPQVQQPIGPALGPR